MTSIEAFFASGFFLALQIPCFASGYVARVRDDRLDKSRVADEKRNEEEIVEEQNCSSRSRSRLYEKVWRGIDEVVYRDHFCDHICAVPNKANEDDGYNSRDPCVCSLVVTSRHDGAKRTGSPSSPRREV